MIERRAFMSTATKNSTAAENDIARVSAFNWNRVSQDLDNYGSAMLEHILTPDECKALAELYQQDDLFRSRVVMGRHGFGRGEYKYFSYPLPGIVAELRNSLYRCLA